VPSRESWRGLLAGFLERPAKVLSGGSQAISGDEKRRNLLSAHLEFNFGEFRAGQMHGPALRVDQGLLRVRLRVFRANRAVSRPISRRSRGRHCELLLTHRFITDKKDGGQHQLPAHAENGGSEPPRGQGDGASEPSLNVVTAY